MIAKGKSIGHIANSVDYAHFKIGSEHIDTNLIVVGDGTDIDKQFRIFQRLNTRATKKELSFVLSPEPKDGAELSNDDFREISQDFLRKMELHNHQSITIKHTDRKHAHLHIYVNRINHLGKCYDDTYVSKRSQDIADEIAVERGLVRARKVKEHNEEKTKDIKSIIYDIHLSVLLWKPADFDSYKMLMKKKGINVLPTINKSNRLQGFRVEFQGHNFKATEVNRKMSLSKIGVNIKQEPGEPSDLNPKFKFSVIDHEPQKDEQIKNSSNKGRGRRM